MRQNPGSFDPDEDLSTWTDAELQTGKSRADLKRVQAIAEQGKFKAEKDRRQREHKLEVAYLGRSPAQIQAAKSLASVLSQKKELENKVRFGEASKAYELAEDDLNVKKQKVAEAEFALQAAESLGFANTIFVMGYFKSE